MLFTQPSKMKLSELARELRDLLSPGVQRSRDDWNRVHALIDEVEQRGYQITKDLGEDFMKLRRPRKI